MSKLRTPVVARSRTSLERMARGVAAAKRDRRRLSAARLGWTLRQNEGRRLVSVEEQLLAVEQALEATPETIAAILAKAEAAEWKRLEQLTEKELLEKALKEVLITSIAALHVLMRYPPNVRGKEIAMVGEFCKRIAEISYASSKAYRDLSRLKENG